MSALLGGGNWWARNEEKGAAQNEIFWRVIAWETVEVTNHEEKPGLLAWINAREPIRSDYFTERVYGDHVLTGFVDELPDGAVVNSWS